MQFAKTFNIDQDIQVLVMMETDKEGKFTLLYEKSVIKMNQVQLLHVFDTEENCSKAFNEYDAARAKAFVIHMNVVIDEATGKNRIDGTSFTKN